MVVFTLTGHDSLYFTIYHGIERLWALYQHCKMMEFHDFDKLWELFKHYMGNQD